MKKNNLLFGKLIGMKDACDIISRNLEERISPQLLRYYLITQRGPDHEKIAGHYYFIPDDLTSWEKPLPLPRGPKAK